MKWQDLDAKAKRNALILAALIALALLMLLWPDSVPVPRAPVGRKVSPVGRRVEAAPPRPPADPLSRMLGKWEGIGHSSDRGICLLELEVRPGPEEHGYQVFSTLSCAPGSAREEARLRTDRAGFMAALKGTLNYTSASFSGRAQDGGMVLGAMDNMGVIEGGCYMASMTLKAFGDARLSVRWQETGNPPCAGGEMLLTHAR
jgi:hypothetical protein